VVYDWVHHITMASSYRQPRSDRGIFMPGLGRNRAQVYTGDIDERNCAQTLQHMVMLLETFPLRWLISMVSSNWIHGDQFANFCRLIWFVNWSCHPKHVWQFPIFMWWFCDDTESTAWGDSQVWSCHLLTQEVNPQAMPSVSGHCPLAAWTLSHDIQFSGAEIEDQISMAQNRIFQENHSRLWGYSLGILWY
jgi:hypothetical protein